MRGAGNKKPIPAPVEDGFLGCLGYERS